MAKSMQTQLSEVEYRRLQELAAKESRSVSNYVTRLLRLHISKKAAA